MRPQFFSSMPGIRARDRRTPDMTLISKKRVQSESGMSKKGLRLEDAGVVDEDVDRAGALDQLVAAGGGRQIGRDAADTVARRSQR